MIVNLTKDGDAEEQAANLRYGAPMLAAMAEGAYGPMHMGRAVTVEGDARFRQFAAVYYPGIEPRRIDELRSHIDLTPTIFDLLDKPKPDYVRGTSLLPEITGKTKPAEGEVIVDLPRTSHNWRRRALIRGRYKIIAFGDDFRFELYDILDDPTEQRDLRHAKKDVYEDMKARYLEKVKSIHDVCPKMTHKLKGKRPGAKC